MNNWKLRSNSIHLRDIIDSLLSMNEAEAFDVCDRHTNRQVNAAILLVNCQRDAPDASVTTNDICLSFVTC